MKLLSIYTDETKILKDEWFLKTLKDKWELNIKYLEEKEQGDGDFGSPLWYYCCRKKVEFIIEAIRNNWNSIILWADIDMQFFGECTGIIEKTMEGNDIACQTWCAKNRTANTGFMAIRWKYRTGPLAAGRPSGRRAR